MIIILKLIPLKNENYTLRVNSGEHLIIINLEDFLYEFFRKRKKWNKFTWRQMWNNLNCRSFSFPSSLHYASEAAEYSKQRSKRRRKGVTSQYSVKEVGIKLNSILHNISHNEDLNTESNSSLELGLYSHLATPPQALTRSRYMKRLRLYSENSLPGAPNDLQSDVMSPCVELDDDFRSRLSSWVHLEKEAVWATIEATWDCDDSMRKWAKRIHTNYYYQLILGRFMQY